MFKRFFLIFCFCVAALSVSAISTLDSLLNVCDAEMAQSGIYTAAHGRYIDSLKNIHPITREMEIRIAREYQYYQSDSATVWFLRLIDAEEPYRTQAYTGLVELSTSIGKYRDGMSLIGKVQDMPDSLRVDWIESIWRLHVEAAAQTGLPDLRAEWLASAQVYYDSLLHEMARQSSNSTDIRLRYAILNAGDADNIPLALAINDTMLSRVAEWSHPYAIIAYNRAMLYEKMGQERKRLEWLTRSSIADVRCGITDNGSSWLVAKDCFESGDMQKAHHFCDYSLTNASFFNAPTRYIQTYTLGHVINNSYEKLLNRYSLNLIIVLISLGVVLGVMVLIAFIAWRQNKRLHSLNREMKLMNEKLRTINHQLKEANHVKEQYICRYLEVYSDYIRRLTTMARKAGEKDSVGFMNREMENFYRSFDDTFLSLYGTFVQDFNALLKPEARLTPKPGERMTVEMRIFALILLGISNSAKIADLLCYSPNTISNYRVKMKNNALGDRETFEQRVQEIGTLY